MATKQKKPSASVLSQATFANTLLTIGQRFSLAKVFDDFLTMAICCCSINPLTKLSHYEDEYLHTIAYYKDSPLRHEFPNAFACLITEMETQVGSELGNDVLGTFFESFISNGRNGQFFTPFHICMFMAAVTSKDDTERTTPFHILDPACGSGRMLLASHRVNGRGNEHYGIDIDMTCVKIAALNLFLNGVWNSEVMCANALMPYDFVMSYRISLFPFGIFKITDKEKSKLWHMQQYSFTFKEKPSDAIVLDNTPFNERSKDDGLQLDLFNG